MCCSSVLQEPKSIVSKKNELLRLIEDIDIAPLKELSSYKLVNGLELEDVCFLAPEEIGSVPCENDLNVSKCEDNVWTISNCGDGWT